MKTRVTVAVCAACHIKWGEYGSPAKCTCCGNKSYAIYVPPDEVRKEDTNESPESPNSQTRN